MYFNIAAVVPAEFVNQVAPPPKDIFGELDSPGIAISEQNRGQVNILTLVHGADSHDRGFH